MMLRLAASVALMLLIALPVPAAILKGVVIEDEGGGFGMDNVSVSVDEAGANSTVTKDGGKFAFTFPDKQVGEVVHVRVNREGYVVVNDAQLEVTLPANPDAKLLTVIFCPRAEREKWAALLYRVMSDEAIEESYQQKLKALKDKLESDTAEFAAEKVTLQQQRDQAKAAAERASKELAKDQPGRSSELYQQAKRLFLDGKVEEAIKLLDDEKLRQAVKRAQERRVEADKEIQDAVQDWLLKAQLLATQFQFNEAEAAYLAAIETAPDSFEANFAFASFNYELNRYRQAEMALHRCLELARKSQDSTILAATLNDLEMVDSSLNRPEDARKEGEEALKIERGLAQTNPETYLSEVAGTLNNLGLLDSTQNRLEDAQEI
jgi:tetratricopeptide (TPR) repeat protein